MINILFVFTGLMKKGGTEAVMLNIFNNIDSSFFHIDFLLLDNSPDTSEVAKHIKQSGAKIFYITSRGKDYLRHRKELHSFFKNNHYDIVHTHMDAIGAEVLREAYKSNISVRIAHSHNTNQLPNPKGVRELCHKLIILCERQLLRLYANGYVACSSEAGQWLFGKRICQKNDNYMLFRNAIDIEKYVFKSEVRKHKRNELEIKQEECKLLGHVGRFDYQKNHEFLIEIFEKLRKKNNNIKLILVGSGVNYDNIRKLVESKLLQDDIVFLGERTDVAELLMAMDIFLLPSRYEGLSVALVEAEASGLQCLVSANTSREADITSNVQFLPIDDVEIWVKNIEKVLSDNLDRRSPVQEIKEAGFDMKSNIKNLERFYWKLYNKKM